MVKANAFEHGVDLKYKGVLGDYIPDEYANTHYRFSSADDFLNDTKNIQSVISDFLENQLNFFPPSLYS